MPQKSRMDKGTSKSNPIRVLSNKQVKRIAVKAPQPLTLALVTNMNNIDKLHSAFLDHKFGLGDLSSCVDWAVDRLARNEEGDDKEIALLAGSLDADEIEELSRRIINRYLEPEARNEELWAGKLLVRLYTRYKSRNISIIALEPVIDKLYRHLNYPNWLVMLSRNCEYATDVDNFVKPFEDEFEYINDLWSSSSTLEEFTSKYDRRVSNMHDII